MTDDELKAIEARAKAADPGPWHARFCCPPPHDYPGSCGSHTVARYHEKGLWDYEKGQLPFDKYIERNKANAEFMAHAREDIPKLLDKVKRLQEKLVIAEGRPERIRRVQERERERQRGFDTVDSRVCDGCGRFNEECACG